MDTEASPRPRHGETTPSPSSSSSAPIAVAGGFGIIIIAFIVAGATCSTSARPLCWWQRHHRADHLVVFAWTFARSLHVERRLAAGLEIDEPKLSILANFRDSGPVPSRS
jgi:hypothetical protein